MSQNLNQILYVIRITNGGNEKAFIHKAFVSKANTKMHNLV